MGYGFAGYVPIIATLSLKEASSVEGIASLALEPFTITGGRSIGAVGRGGAGASEGIGWLPGASATRVPLADGAELMCRALSIFAMAQSSGAGVSFGGWLDATIMLVLSPDPFTMRGLCELLFCAAPAGGKGAEARGDEATVPAVTALPWSRGEGDRDVLLIRLSRIVWGS
jgi:hypothetical protein